MVKPPVRITFSVINAEGETEEWHAELAALSSFRNRGITEAFVEVGERISLFGHCSFLTVCMLKIATASCAFSG